MAPLAVELELRWEKYNWTNCMGLAGQNETVRNCSREPWIAYIHSLSHVHAMAIGDDDRFILKNCIGTQKSSNSEAIKVVNWTVQ